MVHMAISKRFTNVLILPCIIVLSDLSALGSAYCHLPSSSTPVLRSKHQWRSPASSLSLYNCFTDGDFQKRIQSPFRPDIRSSKNSLLRMRRDPNYEDPSIISKPSRLSNKPRTTKVRELILSPLRFKWTSFLLFVLLGRRLLLSRQGTDVPALPSQKALIPIWGIAVVVDILIKMRRVKNWEQYLSDDKDGADDCTPAAQSKSRLFWQVPTQNKKKQRSTDHRKSIYKRKSFQDWTSSKIGQKGLTWIFGCIKMLRYVVEKTTVYVLECEDGKYYVGSTVNLKRRMKQHFHNNRSGSVWTKKYKPIKLLRIYRRVPYKYKLGFEAQVTAELMWDKGINNVRGAMYLYARDYSTQDLNSLVSFIGHYNDLSYKYVRTRLMKELRASDRYSSNTAGGNAKSRRREKQKNLRKGWKQKTQAAKEQRMVVEGKFPTNTTSSREDSLTFTNEVVSSAQQNNERTQGDKTDTYNTNSSDGAAYKAMDEWLNRKTFDESSKKDDENPKTIDDL